MPKQARLNVEKVMKEFREYEESSGHRAGAEAFSVSAFSEAERA
jgi:hypothetical protein